MKNSIKFIRKIIAHIVGYSIIYIIMFPVLYFLFDVNLHDIIEAYKTIYLKVVAFVLIFIGSLSLISKITTKIEGK